MPLLYIYFRIKGPGREPAKTKKEKEDCDHLQLQKQGGPKGDITTKTEIR